jgi:hypothetical protein
MRKRHENLSEDQLAERFADRVVEAWLSNLRRVGRYVEPTVQLLAREGYQAASVLIPGCHLVALSPEHLLIGYVSKGEWAAPPEVEIFRTVPTPPGTRRVIFRWHSLRGIPDRKEI